MLAKPRRLCDLLCLRPPTAGVDVERTYQIAALDASVGRIAVVGRTAEMGRTADIPRTGRRHGCANSSVRIERGDQAGYEKADFERR